MVEVTEAKKEEVVPEIMDLRSHLAYLESNLRQADTEMMDMNLPADVRYRAKKRRKSVFISMCLVNQSINNFYVRCHLPKPGPQCERFGHSKNKESSCIWCGKDNAEIKKEEKEKAKAEKPANGVKVKRQP